MELIIFSKAVDLKWHRHKVMSLRTPIRYQIKSRYFDLDRTIRKNFKTDGATIMFRIVGLVLARTEAMRATTIHDDLIRNSVFSSNKRKNWDKATKVFCLALRLDGVSPWRIFLIRHFFNVIGWFK